MNILLAMDTSSASQVALEGIFARPWPAGSSFEVVSVVEPSHLWTTSEVAQEAARCAEEVVRSAVEKLRPICPSVTGEVLHGDPKTVIIDRARDISADFVIAGSHGVSAITHFLLGNVAAAVLRYAPCSVEVARTKPGRPANLKVLLATDGSECSDRAAQSIAQRPWPAGTQLRVLSAVQMILPGTRALLEPPLIDTAFLESTRAAAMARSQDAIAQARQTLASTGLEVSESISVLVDTPKSIILNEAAQWEADLIVLGSHGRHGVDRFLLGSVSEAVAMHAGCSVEVIRQAT